MTTRAVMVLSNLLERADERAGELAKAYDKARLAEQVCVRVTQHFVHPSNCLLDIRRGVYV
ncbi:DUF2514 family protein [Pseudomonas juntendi]|uniref:DUF2514 family protein n=1 Tax=Pseudomonas juntendi TaxID=2666183 RepID=UPI003F506607